MSVSATLHPITPAFPELSFLTYYLKHDHIRLVSSLSNPPKSFLNRMLSTKMVLPYMRPIESSNNSLIVDDDLTLSETSPKTSTKAGLKALFQLPLVKKKAEFQTKVQVAELQRQAQRIQEQENTIQELVGYSHKLEEEFDYTVATLDTTRTALLNEQASHKSLRSTG